MAGVEALTTYLVYAAMGFIGLVSALLVADFARGRSGEGLERIKALAAELESERAKLRGCEERLAILEGRLEVCERQEQLCKEERQRLQEQIERLRQQLEEKKRELNHLAKENRAALGLYEALTKGKVKLISSDNKECRVLVDGSIICGDRLVWPEVA